MELYDFLLDMGSFPQRELPADDLRSTRNENSGLPGARRYLGQAAAFRLAWDGDPALLDGFTQERDGLLTVPAEKRKPCLAHLMTQAAQGNAAAQEVFRRVGRHIGQINREMAPLLLPRTNVRYLFGRFVKEPACFRLLQEGCREIVPELVLEAADEELSVTPLMQTLAAKGITVAQFGKRISQFQNTQFQLAEMHTRMQAAQFLVYSAAMKKQNHEPYSMDAAMAKLFAAEAASDVTRRAVQLFGGYGYTREYPVERMMRDAKITEIYEGTSEVQRMVIASNLGVK